MFRRIAVSLVLALLPALAFAAAAPRAAVSDTATFAGGCFWSMQARFAGLPGVRSALAGYTGGRTAHPSYEEVCSHTTGHLESVQVVFDPARVTYAQLLDRFWHSIDPTQADGQFCDTGESYESAVFAHGAAQLREASASRAALERSGRLHGAIVTRIQPAMPFWPAEEYHQMFFRKNPMRYEAYRQGCGRDRKLVAIWGKDAAMAVGH